MGVAFYLGIITNIGLTVPNQAYVIVVGKAFISKRNIFYRINSISHFEYDLDLHPSFSGGISGFLGSLIDSIMGATLQYSGLNQKTGAIIESPGKPGDTVTHITGINLLDNHEVNLLSSLFTAILIPVITSNLFS